MSLTGRLELDPPGGAERQRRGGGVLEARGLSVGYRIGDRLTVAVSDLSLALAPGRIVGLAGESGCGKSTLALALAGYRTPGSAILGGGVSFGETDMTNATAERLRELWGAGIAYLPQDSSTALNPALRIGGQFTEVLRTHLGLGGREARERAAGLLARAGIRDPALALARHPHELSGGEQQRVALALAISCQPEVLILDEPTTGLDGRTQAHVVALIAELTRELETATLLISHDLVLLATVCDELLVMYAGVLVERGAAKAVYHDPRHPYTAALVAAIPTIASEAPPRGLRGSAPLEAPPDRCAFSDRCPSAVAECLRPIELSRVGEREVRCIGAPAPAAAEPAPATERRRATALLRATGLHWSYGRTPALEGLSFELASGRVLGVAGESGSGKSTLLRALAGLIPAAGAITLAGRRLAPLVRGRSRSELRSIQIVFQNPDSTLNPRHTVFAALSRPLKLFRDELLPIRRRAEAAEMLERVELSSELLDRLPHELSAGQRQRVAIARALIARPQLLLCDEITSALDLSAQAAVLELLRELRRERQLALVFVSHDLGLLRHIADDLIVLERGAERERGPALEVLRNPRARYTRELIAALPDPGAG